MISTMLIVSVVLQDSPVAIPKTDLPREATCSICDIRGSDHGKEKVAAGFRYKGVAYYLCNEKEAAEFRADPEGFVAPVLPRAMPMFSLTDMSGKVWDAAAFKDRIVLVDFWATWCKPCRELKPIIEKVRESYHKKGFDVLSVSIDEKQSDLDKFLTKNKFGNPVLFDDKQTWNTWKVKAVPTCFLVKDGQIVAQWTGKFKEAALRDAIQKALDSQ